MNNLLNQIKEAKTFIEKKISIRPQIGLILGSGFDSFDSALNKKETIHYNSIPHFKPCSVDGHRGELVAGFIEGIPVVLLMGRPHLYEGFSAHEVVFPIRALSTLGIHHLILTNAAGGINPHFSTGNLVVIDDHINLTGTNPLLGPNNEDMGPRFVDMGHTYDKDTNEAIKRAAEELNIPLHSGVYIGVLGPHYETPAEMRMMKLLGGDMVGMSTVIEAVAARHLGLNVAGISCIANEAAQTGEAGPLSHDDVTSQVLQSKKNIHELLQRAVKAIGQKYA